MVVCGQQSNEPTRCGVTKSLDFVTEILSPTWFDVYSVMIGCVAKLRFGG